MADTLFTKIIRREIPANIVYEDDQCLAFRDINAMAPTHVLVIPKEPIATLNDLEPSHEQLVGHLVLVAKSLAAQEGVAESGYRLVVNCNGDAGQSVFHIHVHLLGGKPMGWPPYPYETD